MRQLKAAAYWTKDILIFLIIQLIIALVIIRLQIFNEYRTKAIILAIIIAGIPFYLVAKLYKGIKHLRLLRLLSKVKDKQWVKPAPTGSVVTALILSFISLIFQIIGAMNIFRQYKVIIDYTQISIQQPDIIAGIIFMIAGFTLSTIVVGMRRYNIINSISMIMYISIRTFIAVYILAIGILMLITLIIAF
jgi:hypothetical protein